MYKDYYLQKVTWNKQNNIYVFAIHTFLHSAYIKAAAPMSKFTT